MGLRKGARWGVLTGELHSRGLPKHELQRKRITLVKKETAVRERWCRNFTNMSRRAENGIGENDEFDGGMMNEEKVNVGANSVGVNKGIDDMMMVEDRHREPGHRRYRLSVCP